MHNILRSISYIFHPLLMPLLGVIFYFSKTPRYLPLPIIKAKLISIFILTIVLPVLLFYLLKSLKKVGSIYLVSTKERIIPLVLNSIIIILVLQRILPQNEIIELYYFFVGILLSTIACLILAILKFKASIHMIAVGGIFMFFIALSIHFSININGTIAMLFILTGAIATSRLYLKAHDNIELVIGFFIGLVPQLTMLNYWLQ
ncbi:MAG: hypothetical protein EX254_01160 [Flavobacteriaceae bacterium]|nr:hypothetical protein [Bacteroidia bacterium]NND10392.1 hypothetical protein [Flavobacteriaceae bacterium]NNK28296.1 hypothetical protein [Flavobacteriaceae bacterium]NNL60611.1 hypothetical protein [Flavobacteriaceae bacterium]RZV69606.1 MAG: hypothetical protein EX254_01160 [Flavobacteriaceae bacterium]